jgi:hypothetical protein
MSIDQAAGGTGDPVASPQGWTFWADNATPPYAPIGQVACTAFTCTWALSGFGAAEAVIPVAQGAMGRLDLLKFYSYRLWAYYGPTLVWGGLATGLSDDGGPAVTVALAELPGYLNVKQYATTQTYTQVEQTTIAGDLAGRLDNIGVPRLLTPGSGFKRNRTYTYLQGQSRGDLLEQLTQVTGGPEFRSEYSLDTNGRPVCALHIAYPRVGSSTSGLALVVPGGAVTFTSTWTSEQMRTRTFSVGDLPPNSPGTATKPSVLVVQTQAGVPEIDHVDDWPGVTDTSTLTERANTFAAVYAQPAFNVSAAVPVNAPPLGSYGIGDDVAVSLADPLVPTGYATLGRLIGATADAAAGTVEWNVAITTPPPGKPSLTRALRSSERHLKNIMHQNLGTPPGGTGP